MMNTENSLAESANQHLRMFRKSLPMQVRLNSIIRSLGKTAGQTCLDIGSDNGMISYYLRKKGGTWSTAVSDEETARHITSVVGEGVYVFKGANLPFKKKTFDGVVLVNCLERIQDDEKFIEECHGILKPDGWLVVNVAHNKNWSLVRPVGKLLGVTFDKKGQVRPGYTESQLFGVLKNGFDVINMHSYSRFFLELADIFAEWRKLRMARRGGADEARVLRIFTIASFFYWIAYQLDILLFPAKGYQLIALAKRRAWRPRNAPVLIDGRSISEAVLNRAPD